MADLTDAAKKEIADAIAIVREDRFEKYVRSRHTEAPKEEPKADELIAPEGTATPPPPKETPPANDPPAKKRDAWWGEILSD
jgi:hypothetical protein